VNNGKICVSVAAETADDMIESIRRAEPCADVIEVRFDVLRPSHLEDLRSQISNLKFEKPLIATYRSPEQGGKNSLTLEERRAFWQSPISGFWAADVEEDIIDIARGWPFRIVSFHDLNGVPDDLDEIFERLSQGDTDAVKIAVRADDVIDTIPIWKLLATAKAAGKEIIPIAMGEAGKWTRILGPAHGAYLTYAALDDGKETAEGQLSAKDLFDVYRVKDLDQNTKVYGVIGDPVSTSLSPYTHNAAFAAAGINAVFLPLLAKDLDAFMTRMVIPATRDVELNFAGFAVTMPHKQAMMKHLDGIDETAEKIGAVNTIKIDNDGKLHGFNTDAHGFITPLKQKFSDLNGARVAVLGSGGAARACAYALGQEKAEAHIFSRDVPKADAFASQHRAFTSTILNLRSEISNFDVLVNATPLGMKGPLENDSPLTADELKGVKLVFDLVTNSTETPLLREAKKAGIPTMGGIEMLIEQGARQFETWAGRDAPIVVMREAALARMAK